MAIIFLLPVTFCVCVFVAVGLSGCSSDGDGGLTNEITICYSTPYVASSAKRYFDVHAAASQAFIAADYKAAVSIDMGNKVRRTDTEPDKKEKKPCRDGKAAPHGPSSCTHMILASGTLLRSASRRR